VCRAAFKNFSAPVAALDEMQRVLKPGGRALIIDLRNDAPPQAIDEAVNNMGLNAINTWLTKMAFRTMLLKRAYSKAQFREMASRSRFKTCQIEEDGSG
jgi:ubiquinone/menaquinone biosynthesis C-methylase UbiE